MASRLSNFWIAMHLRGPSAILNVIASWTAAKVHGFTSAHLAVLLAKDP